MMTRQSFLKVCAGSACSGRMQAETGDAAPMLRLGVMDTSLRSAGRVKAVGEAAQTGFAGIQLSIGRPGEDGMLRLASAETQALYMAAAREHGMDIVSTYLDVLHQNCLKNDPLGRKWVVEGIEITRKLGAGILMLVFFGKCTLATEAEMSTVIETLKELAPCAEKAGVILGFENTLSGRDNMRALDRVGSEALRVYYDVGNSTNIGGFDVPREIRLLGDRICQFHFKDKEYLGEGKVDFPATLRAIVEIGFHGFAVLETSAPSGSLEKDLRRNLGYLQDVMRRA